jgi:hypothetical protein
MVISWQWYHTTKQIFIGRSTNNYSICVATIKCFELNDIFLTSLIQIKNMYIQPLQKTGLKNIYVHYILQLSTENYHEITEERGENDNFQIATNY